MQNPKDLNGVLDYSVWQYEWRVGDDQLTGAMNAAGATRIRLIGQAPDGISYSFYDSFGRRGIVLGDECRCFIEIAQGQSNPFNLHSRPIS
jgi:hypothetical protein